jgi:hypothetical protein
VFLNRERKGVLPLRSDSPSRRIHPDAEPLPLLLIRRLAMLFSGPTSAQYRISETCKMKRAVSERQTTRSSPDRMGWRGSLTRDSITHASPDETR